MFILNPWALNIKLKMKLNDVIDMINRICKTVGAAIGNMVHY